MTERTCLRRASLSFLSLGLLLAAGPPLAGDDPPADRTIRLLDRLEDARIRSPLTGLRPAADLADLEEPDLNVLLAEDFDDFDWEFAGWERSPGGEVVEAGGRTALRLESSFNASIGWVLPVDAFAFYRFARAVRVEGKPFCDVYVVESSREFDASVPAMRQHFLSGRGSALKIHSVALEPTLPGASPRWQSGSTSFYPTARTKSLAVVFRRRAGADDEATVSAMSFDDVRLEAVYPSRTDRIRLLQGANPAPGSDSLLGMAKAGLLLPLPSAREQRDDDPAEANYNWRGALYAPPKTEVAFELDFPQGARLRLATGLAHETPPGSAARFQVELALEGAEPERLVDVVRTASDDDWHWGELDLDLAAAGGKSGTLVLRTLAEKGDPHALWGSPRVEAGGRDDDPLLILIAVDTLRADRLSSYGYERETSPAIDRLAAEGVRFDQARSNCNWTCPSFASIFTGLVPARHGVSSYGPATPLPDELTTLAEHFQSRGWATSSIAYKVPLFEGNYEQGFDESFNVPRDVIRAENNLERALVWLEDHRGGPSFLFLHFNDPHQPFVHPEPMDRKFGHAAGFFPMGVPNGDNAEARERFSDLYDGSIAYVDSTIGYFLDALRARGLYDKAAIVFVADHGEAFWEHGRFGHGGRALFDEVVRVPLIVKPPSGTFEPGRVVTANVSGFDVMPTLLQFGGVPLPQQLDALSLLPLIRGKAESLGRPVVTESGNHDLALVEGHYKLIVSVTGAVDALYDLRADPLERNDVADERPEVVARLSRLVIEYLLEHRPGHYLLAHAGDEPAELRVSTRSVRSLVGPEPKRADDVPSTVALPAGTWALYELEDPDPTEVRTQGLAQRSAESRFAPWVAQLTWPLDGPGVWRFHGPEPAATVVPREEDAPIDVELLEALEALGYTE